ncbi:hypothetical protein [Rubritalea marina]|uniref:hypothetical protein n=1 Tax=Rubritalea marina TaxID=361055 RepID=UPI0012E9D1FA|nr:hypothetical protein [Rubritalea marina]
MIGRLTTISIFAVCLISCEEQHSKIYGTWESDGERTWTYLEERTNLSAKQRVTLKSLFGNASITYNPDGTGMLDQQAFTMDVLDAESLEMEAYSQEFTFEVVGESEAQVVIRITSDLPLVEDYPYAVMRFENNDTYSVSLCDSISEIAGREFFKRKQIHSSLVDD